MTLRPSWRCTAHPRGAERPAWPSPVTAGHAGFVTGPIAQDRRVSGYSASTSGRSSCAVSAPRWSRCRLAARCSKQLAVYQRPQESTLTASGSGLAEGLAFLVTDPCSCSHDSHSNGNSSSSNGRHHQNGHIRDLSPSSRVLGAGPDQRLMSQIEGARTIGQLLDVVDAASVVSMGPQHLRAAFDQLVKLDGQQQEQQEQQQHLQQQQPQQQQQRLAQRQAQLFQQPQPLRPMLRHQLDQLQVQQHEHANEQQQQHQHRSEALQQPLHRVQLQEQQQQQRPQQLQQQQKVQSQPHSSDRQRLLEVLSGRLQSCCEQLSPAQLVGTTCAVATLRYYHQPLFTKLLQAIAPQAESLSAAQAAQLLWAFARHQSHGKIPVDSTVTSALLDWPQGSPKTLATSSASWLQALFGCARLRQPPPRPWLDQFLQHTQICMDSLSQPQLCKVLWALAVVGCDPGKPWVQRALQRMSGRLELSSGWQAAVVLWSLAAMQHAPDGAWMGHFLWHAQRLFTRSQAQDLQLIGWSLARLQYRPQADWVQRYVQRLLRLVGQAGQAGQAAQAGQSGSAAGNGTPLRPLHVAVCCWALAKLQVRPHSRYLEQLTQLIQPLLPAASAQDLSYLVWALQSFKFLPSPGWMAEVQVAMHARLSQFDTASIIMTLTALKGYSKVSPAAAARGMRNEVDSQLVSVLCTRLEHLCSQRDAKLSLRSYLTLVLTLGKLQVPISRELHGYLLQQTSAYLDDIPTRKLPAVAWSICKLAAGNGDAMQLRASSQLQILPRIELLLKDHSFFLSPACDVKDILQLAQGFAAVSYRPADKWLSLHEACAARLAKQGLLRPAVANMLLQSYSQLSYEPRALCKALCSTSLQFLQIDQASAAAAAVTTAGAHMERGQGRQKRSSSSNSTSSTSSSTSSTSSSSSGHMDVPSGSNSSSSSSLRAARGQHAAGSAAGALGGTASRPRSRAEALVDLLTGFAFVSFHPPTAWLEQHEACAVSLASRGDLRTWSVEALLQGYARLGHEPRTLKSQVAVVRLDNLCFWSEAEAKQYFATLLSRLSARKGTVPENVSKLLLALLQHHPDASTKVGAGVAGFRVKLVKKGEWAFHVAHSDRSLTRFSYVKCIKSAFAKPSRLGQVSSAAAHRTRGKQASSR